MPKLLPECTPPPPTTSSSAESNSAATLGAWILVVAFWPASGVANNAATLEACSGSVTFGRTEANTEATFGVFVCSEAADITNAGMFDFRCDSFEIGSADAKSAATLGETIASEPIVPYKPGADAWADARVDGGLEPNNASVRSAVARSSVCRVATVDVEVRGGAEGVAEGAEKGAVAGPREDGSGFGAGPRFEDEGKTTGIWTGGFCVTGKGAAGRWSLAPDVAREIRLAKCAASPELTRSLASLAVFPPIPPIDPAPSPSPPQPGPYEMVPGPPVAGGGMVQLVQAAGSGTTREAGGT